MAQRESNEQALKRWGLLRLVQEHYADFETFLDESMAELGFKATAVQKDIARYVDKGPKHLMVQAQRGAAKTTIASAYAVWSLIHNPATRILIFSAGNDMAKQISTAIVRLINAMETLACLRPDTNAGDRSSVESFDVHHSLKGLERSPSVKCISIGSNMAGNRADILIADDLEQLTNSRTATERANLLQLTMEFKSICSHGRILWLGTPQSTDSIYNALPSRGVDIRIWPARYPTHEQRGYYGGNLAPLLLERMEKDPSLATGGGLTGDQGKPTDPELFGEENLQSKEAGQEAYFQLQQMLNTSAMDRLRYPLKTTNIIMAGTILDASKKLSAPLVVLRSTDPKDFIKKAVGTFQFNLAGVHSQSKDIARMQSIVGYVDPASGGQNGDETGYAVVGLLNSTLYLLSVGGVPGGFTPELLNRLSEKICQFEVDALIVEKNLGHGAVKAVLAPVFQQVYTKKYGKPCRVDDELVTGQKEPRIIKTLEPIMGRGSFVVTPDCVEEDEMTLSIHSPTKRQSYSFFYQLAKITNDRRSLEHDDRIDAVSGACRFFTPRLALDQAKALEEEARKQAAELFRFTLGGKPRYGDTSNNLINSRFRR